MGKQGTRRATREEEQPDEATAAGPRPFWSGTITFGLVSVPVNLFPAVRSGGLRTRMLAPDGKPLRRRYFCPKDEIDVEQEHLVRGYEIEKDEYVVVTDEELEAIAPRKSRDIDLRRFVDASELDAFLFERTYVLTPGGTSDKAYRLLADVMERDNKAGIATFVMRDKEYLVAILAHGGILHAETLRFADEVRSPTDVGLPARTKVAPALVSAFERAIHDAEKPDISRSDLTDTRTEKLKKLVERKRVAHQDVIEAPVVTADEEEVEDGESAGSHIDLMEAIRRSLRAEGAGADARAKPQRTRRPAHTARATKKTPRSKPASTRAARPSRSARAKF